VQRAEVTSAEQLDCLLDRLAARASELRIPFNVTIEGLDGTYMDIIVGGAAASVQWVREDPWECRVSLSSEQEDDDSPVTFAGNGQDSELERRWWIDPAIAREAVRHYFNTGELASVVRWELF